MYKVWAKKAFVLIALLAFFIIPLFVLAQRDLEIDYPNIGGEEPRTIQTGLPSYVKYVFTFFIGISGIIVLGALIWGGFLYMTSAGDASKMKEAKERIFSAFIGTTVLFGSYILLSTINPQLVLFAFPPLDPIKPPEFEMYPGVDINKASYIVSEYPLGQAITSGIWKDDQTKKTEDLILSFESFLNNQIKVSDPELNNDVFTKISDLNKYLKTATDRCQCANLKSYCAKPENGAQSIGCSGDPCQFDQDTDVESNSPRAKINKALEINEGKTKELFNFKEQIDNQRKALREEIRKFQTVEGEIVACENQRGELVTLNQYLADKQTLEESGAQSVRIPNYYQPKQSNLTFYCSAGGSLFDSAYMPEEWGSLTEDDFDYSENFGTEKTGCPIELNTGETLDSLRELAIIADIKLNHLSLLTESLERKIQDMEDLVSKCNDLNCKASCACVPNPCYGCCSPVPCGPCVAFCRSRCLQSVGGCNGDACPRQEITQKAEEIKEIENTIFREIENIKSVFPKITKLKITLSNLDVATGLCFGSDLGSAWNILTCQSALGSYDKNGQLITSCHPRNLFCCAGSNQLEPPIPASVGAPYYIVPAKKFTPLPPENNCPKDWACDPEVKSYNQYKDASEPLKQLLACMRVRLNRLEDAYDLDNVGVIGTITDVNIYKKTCGWETGETTSKGCSYAYTFEYGKEKVSAHYGGLSCRHDHKSYAVDISMLGNQQKEYAQEIIRAAKECSPGAYIIDQSPYIHIDVAQENQCSASE